MRTILISAILVGCGQTETTKPEPKEEIKPTVKADPEPKAEPKVDFATLADDKKHDFLMKMGKNVYNDSALACKTCHQENGEGVEGTFPPLKGQKDHMGDCVKHAAIVIYGMTGELVVNGVTYNAAMTPQGGMLDDTQIAAVTTYERNSWGNDYGDCKPADAKAAREKNPLE